ncbi:hypothetical protein ACFYNL_21705 [Streptomyces sp. NPDC007808]|uniref:hypothetical protein n=1 Tax=Streptomyces sp. NPDC007808 TaxID=3364779 RepID=UPI0036AC8EA3
MRERDDDDRLPLLWEEHCRAPFPAGFRGVDLDGVDLVMLDADVAGLVRGELADGLDGEGVAMLWACVAGLDKVLPLIDDAYCASYYGRLRTMAGITAARYVPGAL